MVVYTLVPSLQSQLTLKKCRSFSHQIYVLLCFPHFPCSTSSLISYIVVTVAKRLVLEGEDRIRAQLIDGVKLLQNV